MENELTIILPKITGAFVDMVISMHNAWVEESYSRVGAKPKLSRMAVLRNPKLRHHLDKAMFHTIRHYTKINNLSYNDFVLGMGETENLKLKILIADKIKETVPLLTYYADQYTIAYKKRLEKCSHG